MRGACIMLIVLPPVNLSGSCKETTFVLPAPNRLQQGRAFGLPPPATEATTAVESAAKATTVETARSPAEPATGMSAP